MSSFSRSRDLLLSLLLAAALACACSSAPAPAPDQASELDASAADHSALDLAADAAPDAPGPDAELCPVPPSSDPDVVRTTRGLVKGYRSGQTMAFRGIPYAAPPVGMLRFAPPWPRACWTNVLEAKAYGRRCPQKNFVGIYAGQEDCLFLNVWTPALPGPGSSGKGYPVLFFVHGGANDKGSSDEGISGVIGKLAAGKGNIYEGRHLADYSKAVVVTVAYRLGPLGWLAHPALSRQSVTRTSGNYALLDLIAALKWVKQNIRAFGGDPSRVLVFGESAGAINTCHLLVSPLARGLFTAALMQSGACVSKPQATREAEGLKLATLLGCSGASDAAACLRSLPPKDVVSKIVTKIDIFSATTDVTHPWDFIPWGPTVDGHVIPQTPIKAIRAGKHNQVPFAIGSNAHEAELFVSITEVRSCSRFAAKVKTVFGTHAAEVLKRYPCAGYSSPRMAAIALSTDLVFTCYARRIAREVSRAQTEPVYRYYYTHGFSKGLVGLLHAFHASELPFVFGTFSKALYFPTSKETALSHAMQEYWRGLADSGSPTAAGAPSWPRYSPTDESLIVLDDQIKTQKGIKSALCDFWDTIVKE
jgi:para-nitrobenzyl esterase